MSPSSRVLVVGSGGMLGRHVASALQENPTVWQVTLSRDRFSSSQELVEYVCGQRPSAVVNCIGFLGQDAASHYFVNGFLPRAVADACEAISALCVLVSTDAVFPKGSERAWLPQDLPQPSTPYEVAKAFGEDPRAYVVRASFIGESPKRVGLYHRLLNGESYIDRRWNGVTALTLARRIVEVVAENTGAPKQVLEHLHAPSVVRIKEVAELLGSSSDGVGVENKTRLLGGGVVLPPLSEQLREYQDYVNREGRARLA